jgi:hypothetical protein
MTMKIMPRKTLGHLGLTFFLVNLIISILWYYLRSNPAGTANPGSVSLGAGAKRPALQQAELAECVKISIIDLLLSIDVIIQFLLETLKTNRKKYSSCVTSLRFVFLRNL